MGNDKKYDGPPSTFVNLKRIKVGEKDGAGRDKYSFVFGLTKDQQGNEVNTCDQLIHALTALQGKQVNLTFHVGEAQSPDGRTFPTGFARVTEMIPKDQLRGQTQFVPKTSSRIDKVKEQAAKLQQQFKD